MFNLTVDEAHTFYVGVDGWLVHNADGLCDLEARAKYIQSLQPPRKAQNMSKTAVTRAVDSNGNTVHIVSSSRNRLTPAQQQALKPGEIEGTGKGHAEVAGIDNSIDWGMTPFEQIAHRLIHPGCEAYQKAHSVR